MRPCVHIFSAIFLAAFLATPATAQKNRKPALETFVYHLARQVAPEETAPKTGDTAVTPITSASYTSDTAPLKKIMQLCVTKDNEIADKLTGLEGRTVKGAIIRIRQLQTIEDISPDCRFLFVQPNEEKMTDLMQLSEIGIVTIGQTERFVRRGGAFFVEEVGRKIGFDINVKAARNASLEPSSKLLQLATKVYGK